MLYHLMNLGTLLKHNGILWAAKLIHVSINDSRKQFNSENEAV